MNRISLSYIGFFKKIFLFIVVVFASITIVRSQNFTIRGSTTNIGGNCFILTPNQNSQNGSVWYNKKIDLKYDFDIQYSINLGTNPSGADGMAFVLQGVNNTIQGSSGSGMGYGGISPSLDLEYDTYPNTDYQAYDPAYDHLCLMKNGNFHHTTGGLIAPIALKNSINGSIKDGQYHICRAVWNAQTLTVYLDGVLKFTYSSDVVNNIFSGNSGVYFGFTASTGGSSNQHSVCVNLAASSFQLFVPFDIQLTSTNATCAGSGIDGTAAVTFNGGNTPYNFDGWTYPNGSTNYSKSIANLPAGTYTATAHDGTGTSVQKSVVITGPVIPSITGANSIQRFLTNSCTVPGNYFGNGNSLNISNANNINYVLSGATTGSGSGTGTDQLFNIGITNVTVTANNNCASATSTFTVTVSDTTTPVINNIPGNINKNNDPGKCGAMVAFFPQPSGPVLDQQITDLSTGTAGGDQWQSFTAGKTGSLAQIDLYHNGCISIAFTLTIYNGVGTSGAILYSAPYNFGYMCSQWFGISIPAGFQPSVTAGQTYTFRIQGSGLYFVAGGNGNPGIYYSSDYGNPPWKLDFKSYVQGGSLAPFATDNCGTPTLTSDHQSGDFFPVGTTPITYTAKDASGNITNSSFNVVVTDNEKPNIKTKPVILKLINGVANLTPNMLDNGSTDNCNISAMSVSKASFDCSNKGINNVIFTVTDINGNTATANEVVTIIDTTSPVPVIATLPIISGLCSATVSSTPTATDGCGNTITGTTTDALVYNQQGTFTILWKYKAANGNVSQQTQQVFIHNTIPPTTPLLPDLTDQCQVIAVAPIATDNCSGSITGTTNDPLTYASQGNFVIHWTFTDGAGNSSTVIQNVIITDFTKPVINSVPDVTAYATSNLGATVNYSIPAASDNCTLVSNILTSGLSSGSIFPIGTTVVTYTATDEVGLINSTSFNVIVIGIKPKVIVPSNISVNNITGKCGANVSFVASDNQGIPASVITYSIPSGSLFSVGSTTVTVTSTNAIGISIDSFTVIVTDNEKPSFVTPAVSGSANVSIPYLQTPVSSWVSTSFTFADPLPNGAIVTGIDLAYSGRDQGWGGTGGNDYLYVSGTYLGVNTFYHSTQNFTLHFIGSIPGYIYGGNNLFQFSFQGWPGWQGFIYGGTMTINYIIPSVGTSLKDSIVNNDPDKCGAVVALSNPLVIDNCGISSIKNDAPSLFPIGTTIVNWTVTDIHNNINTASQKVTVIDNQLPKIISPADVTVNTDSGSNVATKVNIGTPVTSDNCGVASVTNDAPAIFPFGNTTVNWKATDVNGNFSVSTQNIIVKDAEAPLAIVSSSINKINDPGLCGAVVNYPSVFVTDNVSTTSMIISAGDADGSVTFSTPLLNNVNGINFVSSGDYMDIAHGHGKNISVLIELFNPMTNAWVGVQTIQTGPGDFHFGGASFNFPVISKVSQIRFTASEFVGAAFHLYLLKINLNSIRVIQTSGLPSGSVCPVGTTVNSFQTIDAAGNISTSSFTVTVTDVEKPRITSYQSSIQSITSNCSWSGSGGNITVTDNCSTDLLLTENDVDANGNIIYSGQYLIHQGTFALPVRNYPLGINNVQLILTDASGNVSTTANFSLTVIDNINPTIIASGNIIRNADPGVCRGFVRVPLPTVTDNCSVQSFTNSYNGTPNATDNYPVGTTLITWTIIDGSGNRSTATQSITVVDSEAPVIMNVPQNIIQTTDAGICGAIVTWSPLMATDNCSVLSFTSDHQSGEVFLPGVTTVTFTATDIHKNINTATFTITITDNEAPIIQVKPVTITLVNGSARINPIELDNGSTDNCGPVTFSASKTTFNCRDIGINQVTLTVTDSHGNASATIVPVTVIGEIPYSTILITPGNNVFTGGVPSNLYLGYGPQSVSLKDSVTGTLPVSYSWTGTGSISCTTCQVPVLTPSSANLYNLSVTATNTYGCFTTSTTSICVRDIRVPGVAGNVYVCHTDISTGNLQTLSLTSTAVVNQLLTNPQDVLGSCGMLPCNNGNLLTAVAASINNNENKNEVLLKTSEKLVVEPLVVKAYPNPTQDMFNLKIISSSNNLVTVKLIDEGGKVLEIISDFQPNNTIKIGSNLIAGVYFAQILQGDKVVIIKLLKMR